MSNIPFTFIVKHVPDQIYVVTNTFKHTFTVQHVFSIFSDNVQRHPRNAFSSQGSRGWSKLKPKVKPQLGANDIVLKGLQKRSGGVQWNRFNISTQGLNTCCKLSSFYFLLRPPKPQCFAWTSLVLQRSKCELVCWMALLSLGGGSSLHFFTSSLSVDHSLIICPKNVPDISWRWGTLKLRQVYKLQALVKLFASSGMNKHTKKQRYYIWYYMLRTMLCILRGIYWW